MHFIGIIKDLRFQDALDILFLTVVAYYLYVWFRGTKAFRALVGLLVLGGIYTAARSWGLFLTTWVFQILWQVLVILIIILFQSEIRQVLERVNPLQSLGLRKSANPEAWIPPFVQAIFQLARRKIGALIILEQRYSVKELVTEGQEMDAPASPELLLSIFQKESPLHDGAVLVKTGRIQQVACYLPLSSAEGLPKEWGTRHRAALGLSERCDACVIVVSEERGQVSMAHAGQMVHLNSIAALVDAVRGLSAASPSLKKTWGQNIGSWATHRWKIKLCCLSLVVVLWVLLAGQQDFEVTFPVPLQTEQVPSGLQVLGPTDPHVEITVRGLRKDASMLSEKNVRAVVALSMAQPGEKSFAITRDQIVLPNDRIQIVAIHPPQMAFRFVARP